MKIKRYVAAIASLFVTASLVGYASVASFAAATGHATSSGTIKLGASNPISGAIGSVCKPVTDGANAWFQSINAKGGIHGQKISYTVLDDAYDPARAAANATKLLDQGVVALVAGCGTANEVGAETIVKSHGATFIGPYGNLTQFLKPAQPSFFGIFPDYGLQDAAAATFGLKKFGAGTVVHVSENVPGVAAENATGAAAIRKAGGKYLGTVYADPTTTDFTPVALKIKAMHPDYVLFSTGDGETAQILVAMHAQGVVPKKAYLATAATTPALLTTAGSIIQGKFVGVSAVAIQGPKTAQCSKVIKKYGSAADNNLHGYFGCGVAQVVTSALAKVKGRVTTKSLVAALQTLKADTAAPTLGPISFSAKSHAGVQTGTAYGVKAGKYVQLGTVAFKAP